MGLVARLTRVIPLLLVLAFVAAVVYLAVSYRRSPARAKEVLITMFTWLCSGIALAFGLFALYALFERNGAVFDLAATFAAVGLIGLGITLVCKRVFVKHNPHYAKKSQQAETIRRFPWKKR